LKKKKKEKGPVEGGDSAEVLPLVDRVPTPDHLLEGSYLRLIDLCITQL